MPWPDLDRLTQELSALEGLLRLGKIQSARQRLRKIPRQTIPWRHSAKAAGLFRRVGLLDVSVKLLHPLVRGTKATAASADDAITIEYAMGLMRLGVHSEAIELLSKVQGNDLKLHFARATSFITRWDYEQAIPHLEKYIELVEEPYPKSVAAINLVAAFIKQDRLGEAEAVLSPLFTAFEGKKYARLRGNCLELLAQIRIAQGKWVEARGLLGQALAQMEDSVDKLFVHKWLAIAFLREQGLSAQARMAANQVRAKALEMRHWETIRDLDFHLLAAGDSQLVDPLWFGTPFPSFRRKLGAPARTYLWVPDGGEAASEARMDSEGPLQPGSTLFRVLRALSEDFYRPTPTASLFGSAWDECFNPFTGPMRVRQAIFRLRALIHRLALPMEIREEDGRYRLAGRLGFRLTAETRYESPLALRLRPLREIGPEFSSEQAWIALGVHKRSAQRLLKAGHATGVLRLRGNGPARRYSFADQVGVQRLKDFSKVTEM